MDFCWVFNMPTDCVGADIGELYGAHRCAIDKEGLFDHIFDPAPRVSVEAIVHELSMKHLAIGRLVVEDEHTMAAISHIHIAKEGIKPGDDLRKSIPHQVSWRTGLRGALVDRFRKKPHSVHRADEVQ